MDIFVNQLIQFCLNNTLNLCPFTPHIMPRYTHKMEIVSWPQICDVTSPLCRSIRYRVSFRDTDTSCRRHWWTYHQTFRHLILYHLRSLRWHCGEIMMAAPATGVPIIVAWKQSQPAKFRVFILFVWNFRKQVVYTGPYFMELNGPSWTILPFSFSPNSWNTILYLLFTNKVA